MARLTAEQLRQRVEELEGENDRLRTEVVEAASPAPSSPPGRSARGWGWTVLSVALLVIGTVLAPLAVVGNWTQAQLLSTDTFVDTFAPLAADPAVQGYVTDQVVAAIEEQVDIEALTGTVFGSIENLGVGPAATAALRALQGVAVQGISGLIRTTVTDLVTSERFEQVFAQALRTSHAGVTAAIRGDSSLVTVDANGAVGIELAPIIAAVKTMLVDRGMGFAAAIPDVNRTIVIAQSDAIVSAQLGYELAVGLGTWLPWIALAFLLAGVLVARRRSVALVWAGVLLAVAMLLSIAAIGIGRMLFLSAVSPATLPRSVAEALYLQLTTLLQSIAVAVTVVAVALAVIAWLAGPFRLPQLARGAVVDGTAWVRGKAEAAGVTTGRFGAGLHRVRTLIRVLIAAGAAAIVLFVRPLTPSLIISTVLISALALLLLELLRRPPADAGPTTTLPADAQPVPTPSPNAQ